ncbi:MAG: hypothetical protein MUP52_09490 [Candidatus Aminicenantes bacterium]|nr:hypothetical protein [Candidatus Aminicenantes bacterium]
MNDAKLGFKALKPGEQIMVDAKNAVPKICGCGCKYFISVFAVSTLSALMSPTGQELLLQAPVLVCLECKKPLVIGKENGGE